MVCGVMHRFKDSGAATWIWRGVSAEIGTYKRVDSDRWNAARITAIMGDSAASDAWRPPGCCEGNLCKNRINNIVIQLGIFETYSLRLLRVNKYTMHLPWWWGPSAHEWSSLRFSLLTVPLDCRRGLLLSESWSAQRKTLARQTKNLWKKFANVRPRLKNFSFSVSQPFPRCSTPSSSVFIFLIVIFLLLCQKTEQKIGAYRLGNNGLVFTESERVMGDSECSLELTLLEDNESFSLLSRAGKERSIHAR